MCEFSPEESGDEGCKDYPYGGDSEAGDEQAAHYGYPDVGDGEVCGSCHGEAWGCYECHYCGTYAEEDLLYVDVVLECLEEHGYEEDGYDAGECHSERADDSALHAAVLDAYVACHVDGEKSGHTLCYGEYVEEFFLGEPAVLLHHFALHDGQHGVTAAECECSYLAECEKHVYGLFF